jgi:hypothetical protein
MIQAYLDNIKETAAEIAISYTNGRMEAMLKGKSNIQELENHSMRVIYLWGVINYTYLVSTTPYIGGTAVTDAYIEEVWGKLNHYKGFFIDVDLTDYPTIVADDGDGGDSVEDSASTNEDHYRSGNMIVTVGANPVTFIKNGVASPFESNDYTVQAWVISESGFRQNNVEVVSQVAAGFTANDVLEAGTLFFIATLNT